MFERKVIISQSQAVNLNTSSWTATSEGTQRTQDSSVSLQWFIQWHSFFLKIQGVPKNTTGRWTPCFPLLVPLPRLCRLQSTKVRLCTYEERHIGITSSQIAVQEIIQSDFGLLTIPGTRHQSVNIEGWPILIYILQLHRSTVIPSHTPHQRHLSEWTSFQIKFTFHRGTDHCYRSGQTVSWMAQSAFPNSGNNTIHRLLRSWRHLLGSWVFAWMPCCFLYWFKKNNFILSCFTKGKSITFWLSLGLWILLALQQKTPHFKSYEKL